MVEVKMPGGTQTDGEAEFEEEIKPHGGRYEIIASIEEAINLINSMRNKKNG